MEWNALTGKIHSVLAWCVLLFGCAAAAAAAAADDDDDDDDA